MKVMRVILSAAVLLSATVSINAAITIRSTNIVNFDNTTSAVVDNAGAVIANGSGFVGIGTFGSMTDVEIQVLSSGTSIDNAFSTLSSVSMGTGVGLDGLWTNPASILGDTSAFAGQPIFTVIGNGASIAASDQFFIYRHSSLNGTGTFVEDPGSNADAFVAEGASSTGSIVLGGYNNFQHDFGAGSFAAYNLATPIPEPASTSLLGFGAVLMLLRRRR